MELTHPSAHKDISILLAVSLKFSNHSSLYTSSEINELFGKGQTHLAFICSGPYVSGKEKYGFRMVATPPVQGSQFCQPYLIVYNFVDVH